MNRLPQFTIAQPQTVPEASEMLSSLGDTGRLYAGGTELLAAMKEGALLYDTLVDVKTVPGLANIQVRDGALWIGAAVTHLSIESSPLVRQQLPVLAYVESRVANTRVRATGTLAGNLCFAEPHSDPATMLLCLDAQVVAESTRGERWLTIDEFFVGAYETALAEDEVVTDVVVPLPPASWRTAYKKFQVIERPTLGLGVVLELNDGGDSVAAARVAVGCVSETPLRSSAAEAQFAGPLESLAERLDSAGDSLADDADLLDDREGSADYKRNLIKVFLKRAVYQALGSGEALR